MLSAVGSVAAALAAAAAGVVAVVALILLLRTRAELREIRVARWWHGQGEWQSPTSISPPKNDVRTPLPVGPMAVTAETPPGISREEQLQPSEVVREDAEKSPEPVELLLELVEDEEPGTRRDAVAALAGLRGEVRAERLTLVLGRDPSAEVRREAVTALRGSMERRRSGTGTADE